MTIRIRASLPGKYKIVHGKASYDPKRPFMSHERAYELGIIAEELIISPLALITMTTSKKNQNTQDDPA